MRVLVDCKSCEVQKLKHVSLSVIFKALSNVVNLH